MLLQRVRDHGVQEFQVHWRYFLLAQVNNPDSNSIKAWEAAPGQEPPGVLALKAAEVVRRQAPQGFDDFHMALLQARHDRQLDLQDRGELVELAERFGVTAAQMEAELDNPTVAAKIGEDHMDAIQRLGVFGTPTFCFAGGALFVKVDPVPQGQKAIELFNQICQISGQPYVYELKRPEPQ